MKISVKLKGAEALERALRGHPQKVARASQQALEMTARGLCVAYGAATNPPDAGGEAAAEKFRERIGREVAGVFPTRGQPGMLYRLVAAHAPHLAAVWWHAVKSKDEKRAAALLRKAGVPQGGASAAALKGVRTARRGRVDGRHLPLGVVRPGEQQRLAKQQQRLVGVAKAGWYQAARAIGGRVRRNLVDAEGKRSTAEAFPGYVRKVARRIAGLGGALVGAGRVVVFSNVRHGAAALEPRKKKQAEAAAAERFARALREAVARSNKKFGKTA